MPRFVEAVGMYIIIHVYVCMCICVCMKLEPRMLALG